VFGVHAMAHGDRKKTVLWLIATMILGSAFVGLHLTEWMNLMNHEKITPFSNPFDVPLFGATFFSITGLHMTHVAIGVIYLAIIAFAVGRGKFNYEDVEVSGLYWHFVDLVWMFVFPLVYLMSVKG
ncbi:MAG: cytochrome c oxidase subunit 3, partial [Phycisphaerales bacterium]|nr:cytochrome c oxidase subunit 3 [Phycisphaerales bacterium]